MQHIKLGKAQALSDWRSKLNAWNAWRAYVNHIKSDKEAQAVVNEMKEKHRYFPLCYFWHFSMLKKILDQTDLTLTLTPGLLVLSFKCLLLFPYNGNPDIISLGVYV